MASAQPAIRRLGYALGAAVTGVDLTAPLSEATFNAIRSAWLDHTLLCFPGQDLTPQQQTAFAARFGEIDQGVIRHLAVKNNPGVSFIANKAIVVDDETINPTRADAWHSDLSFTDRPGTATFLLAKQLPSVGGDTMFANSYLSYDALSPAYREIIEGLEGVHHVSRTAGFPSCTPEVKARRLQDHPAVVHPVVRTHPESGRKSLYTGVTLRNFVGMTEAESVPIRDFLLAHATRYEFVYRHRWTQGDLVMWDNRCTMHFAVADYDASEVRSMQRCTLEAPISGRFLEQESRWGASSLN